VTKPSSVPKRLWGFVDVLATKGPPIKVRLICVVESDYICRFEERILENQKARDLLAMGWEIEVHAWVKSEGENWEVVRKKLS